jgi:nicotinate-nucleotide adenylyltransferase
MAKQSIHSAAQHPDVAPRRAGIEEDPTGVEKQPIGVESQRIGVFGGTFDPPHNGHLLLANEALRSLALDYILWVITPDPPHKRGRAISPLPVRLRLLQAALSGRAQFRISLVDVNRPGPQYAVDTLRILQSEIPGAALYYLIGGDSLHDLPDWYAPRELLCMTAGLGVLRRPGDQIDLPSLENRLPGISTKINWIQGPQLRISSTDLRNKIRAGHPVEDALPASVLAIIQSEKLYC